MGSSSSKMEDDKALHLCRERKKFVRQALDGRCSLAAAHVSYVQSLKSTGTALRKFTEPEAPVESSLYTSTNATPEPPALTEKTLSQFSFSSPSASQCIETAETFSPSPSPPSSSMFHANHMKYSSSYSKKVEEKPPVPVVGTVTSSSTPQNATPPSARRGPETSEFDRLSVPADSQPWDYFDLFDHQFSFQEGKGVHQDMGNADDITRLREEEGIPELEDDEEKVSSHESEDSQDLEDEFDDEPATDTLVQKFENRVNDHVAANASPFTAKPPSGISASEVELVNGEKSNSPDLSTLKPTSAVALLPTETNKSTQKEDRSENKVAPKDFFSSMKDIEFLFGKASDSGKEVPRMLEANKLHFRPIFPGKENGSMASSFLKACFSCGEDPSQVPEELAQNSVKYITWHRTASSRSSSSRNPLGANSKDDTEDLTSNLFDNFCMISGSHASTLDRLYAWERKLYDEVKASGMVRREYDMKCKILRQLESTEKKKRVEKTRATVKDLHTRIRVAIHRIDSISKRIEELRDKELQPQLEELIEGLSRMWEEMFECHKRQVQIISDAYNNSHARIAMQSEVRRQITAYLENELHSLSSSFNKWIAAQKSYLEAITGWLYKCVSLQQKSSTKRKRRIPSPPLRDYGPPIYATCGVWLDNYKELPTKDVIDSIKSLAGETARFLPRQEKNQVKGANHPHITSWNADIGSESADNLLRDDTSEDWVSGFDHFRASLLRFIGQLYNFADCSVKMYAEVRKAIQDAKDTYSQRNLQTQGSQWKSHAQDGNVNSQPQDDQSQAPSKVAYDQSQSQSQVA